MVPDHVFISPTDPRRMVPRHCGGRGGTGETAVGIAGPATPATVRATNILPSGPSPKGRASMQLNRGQRRVSFSGVRGNADHIYRNQSAIYILTHAEEI